MYKCKIMFYEGFTKLFEGKRTEFKTKVPMKSILIEHNDIDIDYQVGKSYSDVVIGNITFDINNVTRIVKKTAYTRIDGTIHKYMTIVHKIFDIDGEKICLYLDYASPKNIYYSNKCDENGVLTTMDSPWNCLHLSIEGQKIHIDTIATKNSEHNCNLSNLREVMKIISYVGNLVNATFYDLLDIASTRDDVRIAFINLVKGKYPSVYSKYGFKYYDNKADLYLSNCKKIDFKEIMGEISAFVYVYEYESGKPSHKLVEYNYNGDMKVLIESNAFDIWKKKNTAIYDIINEGQFAEGMDAEIFGYKNLYKIVDIINDFGYGTLYVNDTWTLLHKLMIFAKNCGCFIDCPMLKCDKIIV